MLVEKINIKIVQEYQDIFDNQDSFVFVDNASMSVSESENFRKDLYDAGSQLLVCKNRLLQIALKKKLQSDFKNITGGRTAVVFIAENPVIVAKIVKKYQITLKTLTIKGAFIEGNLLDMKSVIQIADIPSREILLAKLCMSMKFPIQGFPRVLSSILRNVVGVVCAIKEKKEKDKTPK